MLKDFKKFWEMSKDFNKPFLKGFMRCQKILRSSKKF